MAKKAEDGKKPKSGKTAKKAGPVKKAAPIKKAVPAKKAGGVKKRRPVPKSAPLSEKAVAELNAALQATQRFAGPGRVYELEVCIRSGMLLAPFVKKNPVLARVIRIRGEQTLGVLHEAIFDAYERFDEHLFEFQIGGDRPMDPKARRYGLPDPSGMQDFGARHPLADAEETAIDDVGLNVDEAFGYWFDFGDDWWHQINVLAIVEDGEAGRYPVIVRGEGASPPQYPNMEEEEEDEA